MVLDLLLIEKKNYIWKFVTENDTRFILKFKKVNKVIENNDFIYWKVCIR